MNWIPFIGYTGGVLLSVQFFPQIFHLVQKKDASQISYLFMATNISGLVCMSTYAVMTEDYPLTASAALSLTGSLGLLGTKMAIKNIQDYEEQS